MTDQKKIIDIFKASPTPTLVLRANSPDYEIIQVNNAYLEVTGASAKNLIGKCLNEAFPGERKNADDGNNTSLWSSLEKVVQTKKSHKMSIQKGGLYNYGVSNSEKKYWSPENTPVLDEENEVEFILHTVHDVTEQVLREIDNKLMYDNTSESFVLVDTKLNIVNFNAQFEKNYKTVFNRDVNKGDSILGYAAPERRDAVKGIYDKVLKGETVESEIKIAVGKNEHRIFDIIYKPAVDAEDNIFGAFVSLLETTQEHKAKESLKLSESRFRALVENGGDVVMILSEEGKPFYISPSIKNVLGYTPDEAMGMDLFSIVHPDDVAHVKEELQLCLKNPGLPLSVTPARMRHKDGEWRWLDGSITNMLHDPSINGIVDNFKDITQKVEAEEARKFEQRDKEALINNTDDQIWSVDTDLNLIAANRAALARANTKERITLQPGDFILSGLEESSSYRNKWENFYRRALSGESFRVETINPKPKKESDLWFETSFNPIYEGDSITGVACFSRNITEAKKIQKDLRDAQQKFRNVVEHSTNMFFQHDLEGVLTYVSPQSADFLGYTPEDAMGQWTEFITDHPINKRGEAFTVKALETGEIQPSYELQLRKKNGDLIWVEVNEAPLKKNGEIVGIVGSLTDITERKNYEDELQASLERYDYVTKATRDAIYDYDIIEDHLHWGKGFTTLFGHDPKDFPLEQWGQHVHPEDFKRTQKILQPLLKDSNMNHWDTEYRFKRADGDYAYVKESGFIVRNENGEAVRMIGAIRDVTEQTELEQLLAQAQKLARIGGWELDVKTNELIWTTITKEIHEVDAAFEADLDNGISFYKEGESREIIQKAVKDALEHGTSWNKEVQIVTAKGNVKWVRTLGEAEFKDGKCIKLYGSIQDIHDRKQAEENLKSVANNIPGAIFQYKLNPDGTDELAYLSDGSKELWGITPDEGIQDMSLIWDQIHEDDFAGLKESIAVSASNLSPWNHKWRSCHPDGSIQWHEGNGTPLKMPDDSIIWDSLILDITAEKEAEQELRFNEQRFKAMVQDGSDLIAILDEEFKFKYVSPSLQQDTQFFVGKSALKFIHKNDRQRVINLISDLSSQKRIFIEPYQMYDIDGKWHWVETIMTNLLEDPAVKGYIVNSKNVTRQIKREAKLQELSVVASKTTDMVIITDSAGKISWINNAFEELTGYKLDEVQDLKPGKFLQGPDTDNKTAERISNAIKQFKPIEEIILNYDKSGKPYWVELNIDPIFDDDKNCTNFIAIERDVTKEVEEEERLKLLESVITNTIEMVMIMEAKPTELPGRKILYVNEAFTNQTGYTKEEVLGKTPHFLQGPKTSQEERLKLRSTLERYESAEVEFINYKKNGEEFWVNTSYVPVGENGNFTHWVAIGRDITDQKQKEWEIQNSLKEKETLLAEIHHRVKNNLAVVSGMMQLQAFDTENKDLQSKLFDSVGRIKTMGTVHELLYKSNSFSQLEFSDTLQILIDNIKETLQANMKVDVKMKCAAIQLNINQAIPTSLIVNEVVTNIFKHAFNGISHGIINFSLKQKKQKISLQISDNGCGLPKDFEEANHNSLGIQLISVLSQQLEAEYSYKRLSEGTEFNLTFTKNDSPGSGDSFS